ncbi:hypothetical protein HD806DRAFT_128351 [Xylariaceae sp. AK1471]|nr:hypothetical protein HD806DRAFT_128351 [Xylariaceae sp. AK1471]
MEPQNGPDGPPPPYSETDIYSHSHHSYNDRPSVPDDGVSIAPSSSRSNIIYTPPDSPSDTQHNFIGPGSDPHTTAAAQAYFDSRPVHRSPGANITIALAITPDAAPSDFPYPDWARDRETSEQDWQTFMNYLIPGHAARANSHIVDRKLQAEGDGQSSASGREIAEAQLAQLKSSSSSSDSASVGLQHVDAVILEWNEGFFGPRGVMICRASPSSDEPAFATEAQTGGIRAEAGAEQSQRQPGSWWRNPFSFANGNNGGALRIGPLHIEGDRVALGSSFEVDSNGVRWRGQPNNAHPLFEASSRGAHWSGQPGPSWTPPHLFGVPGIPGGHPWAGPSGSEGGRGRGRGHGGRHRHGDRRRDHSRSSTSTSSSSSSSDSESSIGSLPDWDDLKDTQLPVTKQSIQAWLAHPDQPISKDMLKQIKADIKAAKKVPPPAHDPSWEKSRENLRREVKDLLQQFKTLKRQQRTAKRAARKELRQQRRAARQERRAARRAEKKERRGRGRRGDRRQERDAERDAHWQSSHSPLAADGGVPLVPTYPGVPSVGLSPPAPHPFPGGGPAGFCGPTPGPSFGFGFGFGRGRGRGRGHGGWEQHAPNVAEHATRAAAVTTSTAREKAAEEVKKSRAHAAAVSAEAVSRASVDTKLAEARALESQIAAKAAQVQAVEKRIADVSKRNEEKSEKGKEKGDGVDMRARDMKVVELLEREMDMLGRKVEALRIEADEEFARCLAEREG